MRVLSFVCAYRVFYACTDFCICVFGFVFVYLNLYACLYLWATV